MIDGENCEAPLRLAHGTAIAPDKLRAKCRGLRKSVNASHRYEFKPDFVKISTVGLALRRFTRPGNSWKVELPREIHPWFLGCQFHPEYKSKPLDAHPLFASFVKAAYENRLQNETVMDKNGEPEVLIHERVGVTSAD